MKRILMQLLIAFVVTMAANAYAAIVFEENFDSGSATYNASNYYKDNVKVNGLIVQQSGGITVPDGSGFVFANTVPNDVSGVGYFLFNGTDDPNPGGRRKSSLGYKRGKCYSEF